MFHPRTLPLLLAVWCIALPVGAQTPDPAATPAPLAEKESLDVETIVLVRHGEKPEDDKGQLSPQGLNRALALPNVLITKFGRPDFIFAPSTTKKPSKGGAQFSYVRPLATIEPTAIQLDLPVETKFAYDDISSLQEELSTTPYRHATVFVAWEHHLLFDMVKHFMAALGGEPLPVKEWNDKDFDSIYVLHIRTEHGRRSITFDLDQEGLNGLPNTYPSVAH